MPPVAPMSDGDCRFTILGAAGGVENGSTDAVKRQSSGTVLYMTADLLARYSEAAGGVSKLETLRIDGLRRRDRLRAIENLAVLPGLLHLELPCHSITSMSPVLAISVHHVRVTCTLRENAVYTLVLMLPTCEDARAIKL